MLEKGLFERSNYGNGNKVVYSKVTFYEREEAQQSCFGIKYVIDGTESYLFNRKNYQVSSGQYLLVNRDQNLTTLVQSKSDVTGICISIDTKIISDVYSTMQGNTYRLLDDPEFVLQDPLDVHEKIYNANDGVLGGYLNLLGSNLGAAGSQASCSYEIYYRLSERLLLTQGLIQQQVNQIKAEKYATRKELFRRIEQGRQLMEDTFCDDVNINNIASVASMSPFHFSRIFKQVYRVSPYQFVLQKRLEKARHYLENKRHTVSEIAFLTGFADIHSFSKSFKKAYAQSPKIFQLNY